MQLQLRAYFVFFLSMLLLSNSSAANANGMFAVRPLYDPDAPVELNACQARSRDASIPDFYFDVGVRFTNVSRRQVSAVRFKFGIFNSFGEEQGSTYLTQEGHFSPAAQIDKMGWYPGLNHYGSSGTVKCSVDTVAFEDGDTWHAGTPQPISAPEPTSAQIVPNDPPLLTPPYVRDESHFVANDTLKHFQDVNAQRYSAYKDLLAIDIVKSSDRSHVDQFAETTMTQSGMRGLLLLILFDEKGSYVTIRYQKRLINAVCTVEAITKASDTLRGAINRGAFNSGIRALSDNLSSLCLP